MPKKAATSDSGRITEASTNIPVDSTDDQSLPEKTILFDETHNELLKLQKISDDFDDEVDTWDTLASALRTEFNGKVTFDTLESNKSNEGFLTEEILRSYQVLALVAPRKALSNSEVAIIANFVDKGGSLLIAQNYESLYDDKTNHSINLLLAKFGLRTKPLLNSPPENIFATQFKPHYLSSEINQLVISEPAYLETLNSSELQPHVVANLPCTDEPFLVAVEVGNGRVVAIGDFVLFGDEFINKADNKTLVLNIFRWLLCKNSLDCFDVQFNTQIKYGNKGIFSILLKNPQRNRLQYISCLLESDTGALIDQPEQRIRSLPSSGKALLTWTIEPQKLGDQILRLTIDFPEIADYSSLFFDSIAQFQCIPDVEIDLINLNSQQKAPEIVETGVPFEMEAIVRWKHEAKQMPLQFLLDAPLEHISIEPMGQGEVNRWRIIAFDEGDWKLSLKILELNQSITRLIRAYPSIQKQINNIERDIVLPLVANVHHQVSLLRQELVSPEIVKIPFRLLTPEEQVRLVEAPSSREDLLAALKAALKEKKQNFPLVQFILQHISPIYSVIHGCCIPYEPKLADHLIGIVEQHPSYEEHIAYNFMSVDDDERFGRTWLQQNIAALILHEKYGHGFFYNATKLGKQLEILYRHGLVFGSDSEQMRSPYPRLLYTEYEEAIGLIYYSTLIVNEGFATWLELATLPQISELIGQAAYRRRDFLFNRDTSMVELARDSEYFQNFPPQRVSKYREGCEYLELIQGYFGKNFGPRCAVQAMLKATDIDLGITESDGKVQFALDNEQIKSALLEDENHDARADQRLRAIHDVLRSHKEEIWSKQEKLQCYRSCLHCECPVNGIISTKLSW
ncbi:hypothetical protein CAL7716_049330 [Calothrix sp. PCC 7716]|nr:hypothetical protein CAL7716_049330 [Calothrix sp. PCC 7716]